MFRPHLRSSSFLRSCSVCLRSVVVVSSGLSEQPSLVVSVLSLPNVVEETGEDGMNILNEHNSIAVENNNWQQYQSFTSTSTDSSDDENNSVAFHHGGEPFQQVAPQLITPSDCSENDNAINGGTDIATFFHGGRSTENVHHDGKKF